MATPVVADAETLFGATTRGLLIYLSYHGVLRLHWSPLILDEMSRALVATKRKRTLEEAKANEKRMREALPGAMVTTRDVQAQFISVEPAVRQTKDMHVAACARHLVTSNAYPAAEVVVLASRNTRDFSAAKLADLGVWLQHPDTFLTQLLEDRPSGFADAFRSFRLDLKSRPDATALLAKLQADGHEHVVAGLLKLHRTGSLSL